MTRNEARERVLEFLRTMESAVGFELALIHSRTLERGFGWVFFYDSKRHLETGDFRDGLAGNAPIVVTKKDGKIHETGTAYPIEHYLRQFERYAVSWRRMVSRRWSLR